LTFIGHLRDKQTRKVHIFTKQFLDKGLKTSGLKKIKIN